MPLCINQGGISDDSNSCGYKSRGGGDFVKISEKNIIIFHKIS